MSDWQEYRWAFDPGKRDEACFTLLHWACDQWHCELRAYGVTAVRLNDAFQAEAALTAEREARRVAEEALRRLVAVCDDSASCGCAVTRCTCGYVDALDAARTALKEDGK